MKRALASVESTFEMETRTPEAHYSVVVVEVGPVNATQALARAERSEDDTSPGSLPLADLQG